MASSQTTLKSIAERLGLSVTTVSRVLNGRARKYRISEKTEEAVMEVARRLNFLPNQLARGLRLNRTLTIGLVIPDISNTFFANIARNVETEARKRKYSTILCDSGENTELEIESLELLRSRKVDGLVLSPVGEMAAHLKKYENSELPIVIVDRYLPDLKLPYVASDNYKGAHNAVSFLIENGHKTIACIQGLRKTMPNIERLRGYEDALKQHRIQLDKSLIVGNDFGQDNGYIQTKLLLSTRRDVTAILALSNLISLGALRAIQEEGLNVPGDISIISFDDQPYSAYLATPMTTVAQNNAEMGRVAVQLLFDQIDSPQPLQTRGLLLPTEFIERKSVRRLH